MKGKRWKSRLLVSSDIVGRLWSTFSIVSVAVVLVTACLPPGERYDRPYVCTQVSMTGLRSARSSQPRDRFHLEGLGEKIQQSHSDDLVTRRQ